jgi:hypothetical protein
MPFRVLAAVVGIAAAIALVRTLFLMWRGARSLTVGDAVMLPGGAWLLRLAFYAAVDGKPAADIEWWPCASRTVMKYYALLVAAYWAFRLA